MGLFSMKSKPVQNTSYQVPKSKDIVRKEKGYNGWTNYKTWLVSLNVDNNEGTYNMVNEAVKSGEIHDGESYKEYFKETFQTKENGFYKIEDSWSERELDTEVDWNELYEAKKGDLSGN